MEAKAVREVRTHEQAALEDVFFGQSVILWARWSVILAGAVLVLWTSTTVAQLTRTFPFFLVLMAMNFFLHGRYVMGSPLNRTVVVAASIADLVLITGDHREAWRLTPSGMPKTHGNREMRLFFAAGRRIILWFVSMSLPLGPPSMVPLAYQRVIMHG